MYLDKNAYRGRFLCSGYRAMLPGGVRELEAEVMKMAASQGFFAMLFEVMEY